MGQLEKVGATIAEDKVPSASLGPFGPLSERPATVQQDKERVEENPSRLSERWVPMGLE